MAGNKKWRLDELVLKHHLAASSSEAERLIRAGKVLAGELIADKPGALFSEETPIRVKKSAPFVSRGGLKLKGALSHFSIEPAGWVCADIGASTGGFTDCLLQNGARLVYAVDVGYGQLDWKLRTDPRVVVLERLNVRKISNAHIAEPLDLAVFDASFISLAQIIPPVLPLFGPAVRIIALIKPQFEVSRHQVEPGGVVKSELFRQQAVAKIARFGHEHRLTCRGIIPAAIKGPKGNQEYLICLEGGSAV